MAGSDRLLELSTEQSLAGSGVLFSDNHIELASLPEGTGSGVDLGDGNDLWSWFHITETFAGGNFVTFELVMNAIVPGDFTDVVIASTGAIPIVHPVLGLPGPLVLGESHTAAIVRVDRGAKVPIFPGVIQYPASYKFLRFRYTLDGTFTAGKVTSRITDKQPPLGMKIYPAGKPGNR